MRRDDGTTGVLEYMEQLSWLIFLKIFEDIEKRLEIESQVEEAEYRPIIEPKYRWSSWAKTDWRGEQLIKFIDDELFPYLRSLSGTPEKETISTIFSEIAGNRMKSPFNLKDVITVIDEIDFNNPNDSHVVSQVYEELLLRMGKEGGVAGEFYTPRPIVKLMVKIVNPEIGEKILDPFCGSGGFLAESYNLMKSSRELSRNDYEDLQRKTFFGQEKKPFPYLLGVMNCILHGLLTPNIIRKNTLEDDIRHIPVTELFDVIMTNPPFGGKEGQQIQQNFPIQSQATELLALQYVMKKLKTDGRCGIVVPEGVLFRGDAFAQVKKELLENFNLHSVVSLPSGVFANVTSSGQGPKTNLLFFERSGPTREIWFYEHIPNGDKKYTKANPIMDEDLKDCYERWKKREVSEKSWNVPVEEIVRKGYDLTAKNPNRKEETEIKTPEELVSNIAEKERAILKTVEEIQALLVDSKNKD
jgi:type I restriction enzyme M protein